MGVLVAQNHPSMSAFPDSTFGSACTSSFSRIAQRSLALRPAHSRGHQFRDRHPGASDISSPPCLPRLLPAGAVAGRGLHPLEKRRLVTAHVDCRPSRTSWRTAGTRRERAIRVIWDDRLLAKPRGVSHRPGNSGEAVLTIRDADIRWRHRLFQQHRDLRQSHSGNAIVGLEHPLTGDPQIGGPPASGDPRERACPAGSLEIFRG